MGNTGTTGVTLISGLRRARESQDNKIYQLVDMQGGGELIGWTKYALSSGDYSILDGLLEVKVSKFLYGTGKGKLVPVSELVKIRNQERNAMLGALRRKKGKGKSGPNILENVNQDAMQGDMMKGTTVHNELVKRLINMYPKLVNDIFLSEDHYGNSALHQAIVNEDPEMVRFLLLHGADIHQRCCGAFFCPDDQRASRMDSMEHEWCIVNQKTNYSGRTYWGEYPLSFAACTGQEDCFRLLRARKADPNMKDTNGNTVLHMMVIHENPARIRAFDMGNVSQYISTARKQHAPLTRTLDSYVTSQIGLDGQYAFDMFDHVLTIERDVLWTYGGVICAAYPLQYIDTIEQGTGELNELSALSLIVHGGETKHLELLDGLMEDLLQEKWNAFAKKKYNRSIQWEQNITTTTTTTTTVSTTDGSKPASFMSNMKAYYCHETCHLLHVRTTMDSFRIAFEILTVLGIGAYATSTVILIRRLGWKQWFRTLTTFPAKLVFHFSFIFVMLMIPLRMACLYSVEHIVGIMAMLTTSFHFLFFCRGIKFIGPFVLMVYKIISGDMIRFFIIYLIFVVGFSQSFFIIFLGCHRGMEMSEKAGDNGTTVLVASNEPVPPNILTDPIEAFMRMFIMSLGEFSVFYKHLHFCRQHLAGKVMFMVFELGVSIMLLNLLIAMMARTYQEIAETQKEWKRQWAKVILMLEEGLKPNQRLLALLKYSRPIGTDKRKRAFVVKYHQSAEESKTEKETREKQWQEFMEEKRALYKRRLQGDLSYSRSVSRADGLLNRLDHAGNLLPNMLNQSPHSKLHPE